MAENVSSNVLFHFTSSLSNLKSILKNGFWPRYCPEYDLGEIGNENSSREVAPSRATAMVCFCDLPLSLIRKHLKEYGNYGIGLRKDWGLKNGVAPVIYTHPNASIGTILTRLGHGANAGRGSGGVEMLSQYTKAFRGPAWRRNRREEAVPFYDEREWRYVPAVSDGLPLSLNWNHYSNESRKDKFHDRLAKEHALRIAPDDIEYLIVPHSKGDKKILDLYRWLKVNYEERDAILVTTAIMTTNRIKEDI